MDLLLLQSIEAERRGEDDPGFWKRGEGTQGVRRISDDVRTAFNPYAIPCPRCKIRRLLLTGSNVCQRCSIEIQGFIQERTRCERCDRMTVELDAYCWYCRRTARNGNGSTRRVSKRSRKVNRNGEVK